MPETLNPYESPRTPSRPIPGWREWLFSWFRQPSDSERFLRGERAFHYGVVFHVDPYDDTQLVAYLPLAVDDEEHVRRNVEEARRVLAEFLTAHADVAPTLLGRTLVVSMIPSYTRIDDVIRRIHIPASEWHNNGTSPSSSGSNGIEDTGPDSVVP